MPAATIDREDPAHAGQAVDSPGFLSVYDALAQAFPDREIRIRGLPLFTARKPGWRAEERSISALFGPSTSSRSRVVRIP